MNENRPPASQLPASSESEPIHNYELEKTVVATLVNSYREVVNTLDILDEDCFYNITYREIYKAVMEVYNRGEAPDMMLVSTQLAKDGSQISVLELTELCVNTMQVLDLVPHAHVLRDYSFRRKLWLIGYNLMNGSSNEAEMVVSLHSEAKKQIDALFEDSRTDVSTLDDSYRKLQEHMLLNRDLQEGETFGTPTGFHDIDKNGGLCGTDLIVIGAETSKGKTSFATALSMSALEHGDGVAFYSMEMQPLQLTARIASMRTGISSKDIMFSKLPIEDIYRIDAAMEGIDKTKMFFDERSTMTLDSILMSIRSLKLKYDIKGAVVDYLQLVNTKQICLNREQATAECARSLKNLAKELNIWIIAISQLSRNSQSPIPTMARLRDSGQIEEAADNIYLIHRTDKSYPEPFKDIPVEGTAMVSIGKGRHVGTGEFICGFNAQNTLFYPISPIDIDRMKTNGIFGTDEPRSIEQNYPF